MEPADLADPGGLEVRTRSRPFDGDLFELVRPWLARPGGFLLDSNGPVAPWSRWSLAGPGGGSVVTLDVHDRLVVRRAGADPEVLPGDPLDALGRLVLPPRPRPQGAPLLPGGLVGMVGYEALRFVEDVPVPPSPAGVPDLWFTLADRVVAHDRRDGRLVLSAVGAAGEDVDARLDALEREVEAAAADAARRGPGPDLDAALAPVRLASTHDRAAYVDAVERVKAYVRSGDVFQANIARTYSAPAPGDPVAVYARLRKANPGPFNAFLHAGDIQVASSSPERLFRLAPGRLEARPIAGTRPRAADPDEDAALEADLLADAKEAAEHAMIVDLYRNDVARVAEPASVHVEAYRSVERYARVRHLTSNVVGRPRGDVGPVDALRALFPGGSITGAPKVRAMEVIAGVEPGPRGPYTGGIGHLGPWGADLNILIRTLVFQGGGRGSGGTFTGGSTGESARGEADGRGTVSFAAGGGVVQDSDPAAEHAESLAKAQALFDALAEGPVPAHPHTGSRPGRPWRLPEVPADVDVPPGRRVLLVDNVDSFVHNLAHYLATLGADVRVVRNDAATLDEVRAWAPTHVVLSPGPGRPEATRLSLDVLKAMEGEVPILGVCLGHQAIAHVHGERVRPAPEVVHGKASAIVHGGASVLAGVPSPFPGGRYHSLHVHDPPSGFSPIAETEDGLLMGMVREGGDGGRGGDAPTVGLAFHPESVLTDHGMRILANFLAGDG